MAGISSKAAGKLENKKGYNGNEIQNREFSEGSGLDVYDFNARTYDPQIGRFIQIDPLSDSGQQEIYSPFHFAENNPIKISDPTGKCGPCVFLIPPAVDAIIVGVTSLFVAKVVSDQLTPVILQSTDDKKETGSYTNLHEKGRYHGKGGSGRAAQSANEKEKEYNDPHVSTDYKPEPDDVEAFKAEAKRIRDDGGVENPLNYNKRNSPGEKLLKKEVANSVVNKVAVQTGASMITTLAVGLVKIMNFFNN